MYRNRMPVRPAVNRASPNQLQTFLEEEGVWRRYWPFVIATIIGVFMLIFGLAVAALEAAELDMGSKVDTTTVNYGSSSTRCGNSYRIGVGIWSGAVIAVAAISIFIINCASSVKHWAHIAIGLVGAAAVFSVTNFSINAKIVRTGVKSGSFKSNNSDEYTQYRLAASQIAAASLSFLVCLAFLIMYGIVYCFQIRRALPKQKPGIYQRQIA